MSSGGNRTEGYNVPVLLGTIILPGQGLVLATSTLVVGEFEPEFAHVHLLESSE